MDERELAHRLCAARLAFGAALLVAPGPAAWLWTGERPGPGLRMTARAVGGRDLALALGGLSALERGAPAAWLRAGALADASDALGALIAFGHMPRARRRLVMGAALGAGALGLLLAARVGAR